MQRLLPLIESAQQRFANLLAASIAKGPLTPQVYQRYLSMQFHLTKGVQRYFMIAAAHQDMVNRNSLRNFLIDFAAEERLHYVVAGNDLRKMGLELLPEPFDVTLWHAYFEKIVIERPFVRLGAACILENISAGAAKPVVRQVLAAPFLNRENTKFLVIHQHEKLPHGDQIIEALATANLTHSERNDLAEGARKGAVMYLRMAEWAVDEYSVANFANDIDLQITNADRLRVEHFDMSQLDEAPESELQISEAKSA